MRKLMMVGALLAMLVLSVSALAGSASATEWLCNEKVLTDSKTCSTDSVNLEVLLLKDMGAASEIDCAVGSVLGTGTVGPGAEGEITGITIVESSKNCTAPLKAENLKGELVNNACEKLELFAAENLPWKTKLEVVGTELRDQITATSAYVITCRASGLPGIKDLCEGVAALPPLVGVENLAADSEEPKLPLVDILFPAEPFGGVKEWGTCSIGGVESALESGEILLEALIEGKPASLEAMD